MSLDAGDVATMACELGGLTTFAGVVADPLGEQMRHLLECLAAQDASGARRTYLRLFAALAERVELGAAEPGDAWQDHLLNRVISDDGAFSRKCSLLPVSEIGGGLRRAAERDLRLLGNLHALSSARLVERLGGDLPRWDALNPLEPRLMSAAERAMRERLARAGDWGDELESLARFYHENGAGALARYAAFRWNGGDHGFDPIEHVDPIRLEDLIGYDVERELVIRNTRQFVAGHIANNVLLYGDRGTGKSSTVKALANEYRSRGLRLVEVPKARLADLPEILRLLRPRPERFILFVDDLSFDENESHYRDLKAIVEGGVEARPENVLLYATSNRRHIVMERFSDRGGPLDEIHAGDTSQEKLSLSDRFGIAVTFAAPDQERFLQIVAGIAAARGLSTPAGELRRRALEWAAWQNGRSGRTARQFVDYLAGELAMSSDESASAGA